MIGCLGNDMDGKQLYTSLVENHVHMDGVIFDPVVSSGKAYISVDKKGGKYHCCLPGGKQEPEYFAD